MRYLSLFSGIGGFELGIGNEHECIGYSEIDKYAIQVYQSHFPEHHNYGDITKIKEDELPNFDLLVGGFPCQSFSIAGKRRGFEDTRGTLFFDIARILQAKSPTRFILENVKGLLSHDNGNTFKTIIATLDELGYAIQWQVLNSKYFGVPQNRERVYIVGHLRGTNRPEVFPFTGTVGAIASDEKSLIQLNDPSHSTRRVFSSNGISPTLKARAREDETAGPLIYIREATKKGYAEARVGDAMNLTHPNSKTRRGRVSNIAGTLETGMNQYTLMDDGIVRRLTPIECERLQGFPDGWTADISDTQRYKTLGNAVTVNVIREVIHRLCT